MVTKYIVELVSLDLNNLVVILWLLLVHCQKIIKKTNFRRKNN